MIRVQRVFGYALILFVRLFPVQPARAQPLRVRFWDSLQGQQEVARARLVDGPGPVAEEEEILARLAERLSWIMFAINGKSKRIVFKVERANRPTKVKRVWFRAGRWERILC